MGSPDFVVRESYVLTRSIWTYKEIRLTQGGGSYVMRWILPPHQVPLLAHVAGQAHIA